MPINSLNRDMVLLLDADLTMFIWHHRQMILWRTPLLLLPPLSLILVLHHLVMWLCIASTSTSSPWIKIITSWKSQVFVVLSGNELLDYVEGKMTLTGKIIGFPLRWQQDQLILGWFLAMMSPSILPQVVNLLPLRKSSLLSLTFPHRPP